VNGPRCSATTKAGKPCRALAGADGLCTAHSGKVDMRELGHRGGRSRRKGVAEELPERERRSLREFLRDGLDHETIKAAIERSLAGGNESARVACIKFLSDLELYRKDGDVRALVIDAEQGCARSSAGSARRRSRRARTSTICAFPTDSRSTRTRGISAGSRLSSRRATTRSCSRGRSTSCTAATRTTSGPPST
jgi:hypothetical protein